MSAFRTYICVFISIFGGTFSLAGWIRQCKNDWFVVDLTHFRENGWCEGASNGSCTDQNSWPQNVYGFGQGIDWSMFMGEVDFVFWNAALWTIFDNKSFAVHQPDSLWGFSLAQSFFLHSHNAEAGNTQCGFTRTLEQNDVVAELSVGSSQWCQNTGQCHWSGTLC